MSDLRQVIAPLAAALSLVVSACGGGTTLASSELIELGTIDQLAADFNEASGAPRLILLLSPT